MKRPEWDEYFLLIAATVALRGDCTRHQVGAVIVRDHRIVSTGYNGAPAGEPGCLGGACPRGRLTHAELPAGAPFEGRGECIAVHAEANALLYADRDHCVGATLYCTYLPCSNCERLIRGAGIARIVVSR